MKEQIKLIGNINFKDIKVKIYHDPYTDKNNGQICWQMRNPETVYTGTAFMNYKTGQITYPENAIIPEQTDKDCEILPKFVITGCEELTDKFIEKINIKFKNGYNERNIQRNTKSK